VDLDELLDNVIRQTCDEMGRAVPAGLEDA
jgi:hypothetical protein